MAASMVALRSPGVGSRTTPLAPAYATRATRSRAPSRRTRRCRDCLTRGSLSGDFMEPETSTRNTRFAGGSRSGGGAQVFTPMRSRWVFGFQGEGATSVVTAKGASRFVGAASE